MKTFKVIAQKLNAISNCIAKENLEWREKHEDAIRKIMENAPSGSGIDCGTKFDIQDNLRNPNKLIFATAFHHMDENGYYCGWTEHKIIVTPSLQFEFNLKITGCDKNQIKEYLSDIYNEWLDEEIWLTGHWESLNELAVK